MSIEEENYLALPIYGPNKFFIAAFIRLAGPCSVLYSAVLHWTLLYCADKNQA